MEKSPGGKSGRKKTRTGVPSYLYVKELGRTVKFDVGRMERRGFPEVVLATGKSDEDISQVISRIPAEGHPVVISRLDDKRFEEIVAPVLRRRGLAVARRVGMVFISPPGWKKQDNSDTGKVAIVTAGSSDIHVAAETAALLDFLGYSYKEFYDCGIAGMHRTIKASEEVLKGGYTVAIVFAGMEGALASVFASLVPIPVIGVPTSTGYGFGGAGEAALGSMLQSCVPGLLTVNIDNSVGAAAAAISILRSSRRHE